MLNKLKLSIILALSSASFKIHADEEAKAPSRTDYPIVKLIKPNLTAMVSAQRNTGFKLKF